MATTLKHHHELINGVGKCSVPMWQMGCPAGFCDAPAYGKRPPGKQFRNAYTGELTRFDGRYNGYVPDLACPGHGGPEPLVDQEVAQAAAESPALMPDQRVGSGDVGVE